MIVRKPLPALVAATVLAAGIVVATPASAAVDQVIRAGAQRWRPEHSFVRLGRDGRAVVKWVNRTSRVHDLKSTNEGTDWRLRRKTLRRGDSVRKVFRRRGNYYFRCVIHSVREDGRYIGMVGIVHVRR